MVLLPQMDRVSSAFPVSLPLFAKLSSVAGSKWAAIKIGLHHDVHQAAGKMGFQKV